MQLNHDNVPAAHQTLNVRYQGNICFIQMNRPEANNAVNNVLVRELGTVLETCGDSAAVVVLEGLPEVFCSGADFADIRQDVLRGERPEQDPELLYDLWLKLAGGPFMTIAHVRGKANAGGVGFASACDVVLADHTAVFSLSELLFGLYPACVLPFLIRRTGFQKAHYMTLTTQPVSVQQAQEWGLVDAYAENSDLLLRKHLNRLERLSPKSVRQYKSYMSALYEELAAAKQRAVSANRDMFADAGNRETIFQFVQNGKLPWDRR